PTRRSSDLNARVPGWQLVRSFLSEERLVVFKGKAPNLIRTLPELIHSATIPEDLDTTGEDHPADTLRYGLMEIMKSGTKQKTGIPVIHREGQALLKRVYN